MIEHDEEEGEQEINNDVKTEVTELINHIQKGAKKLRHGIEFSKLKTLTLGKFKRPKVWSNTRMAVYEFDMLERFLKNSIYLDEQSKFILLAQTQCLVMFTLKLILKNFQTLNVTSDYVQKVVASSVGEDAMLLASQVAVDLHCGHDIGYLSKDNKDKALSENTNICMGKTKFCEHLQTYVTEKSHFFLKKWNHLVIESLGQNHSQFMMQKLHLISTQNNCG